MNQKEKTKKTQKSKIKNLFKELENDWEKAAIGESSKEVEIHIYMTVSHISFPNRKASVQQVETTLADMRGMQR